MSTPAAKYVPPAMVFEIDPEVNVLTQIAASHLGEATNYFVERILHEVAIAALTGPGIKNRAEPADAGDDA